jgi:hypothetical protein
MILSRGARRSLVRSAKKRMGAVAAAGHDVANSMAASAVEHAANGLLVQVLKDSDPTRTIAHTSSTSWQFQKAPARRMSNQSRLRKINGPDPSRGMILQDIQLNVGCSIPHLNDSVLQIPDLATPAECSHLIAAADSWCRDHPHEVGLKAPSLTRVECHPDGVNLDGRSHAISMAIIVRALRSIEVMRPELAEYLFGQRVGLADMWITYSGAEPTINVYTAGGACSKHTDEHMLTVLLPLSCPDVDFLGGGTGFWAEGAASMGIVLRPSAGTAMLWRGHVPHAGLQVVSGRRHAYVVSFNLLRQQNEV